MVRNKSEGQSIAISLPSRQWQYYRGKNAKMYLILHLKQYWTTNRSQEAYPPHHYYSMPPWQLYDPDWESSIQMLPTGWEAVIGICYNLDLLSCKACWDLGSWSVRRQEMFLGWDPRRKGWGQIQGSRKEKGALMNSISPLLPFIYEILPSLLQKGMVYVCGMLLEHEPRMGKSICSGEVCRLWSQTA